MSLSNSEVFVVCFQRARRMEQFTISLRTNGLSLNAFKRELYLFKNDEHHCGAVIQVSRVTYLLTLNIISVRDVVAPKQ